MNGSHVLAPHASSWSESVTEAERVVISAFRHWISGHTQGRRSHWSIAWHALSDLFGATDGTRAVTALEGMIRTICLNAARPISYHQPHCPCIGRDERTLIALLASCQRRQWLNAAGHANRLVTEDGTGALIEAAARFAAILAAHNHHLPIAVAGRTKASVGEAMEGVASGTLH